MSKFNNTVGRTHMILLSRSLASNLFLAIILVAGISITPLLIGAKANATAVTNPKASPFLFSLPGQHRAHYVLRIFSYQEHFML